MFLLETNVLSELRKAGDGKADRKVVGWLAQQDAASFYVSVLTLMEIEIGILRVERRDRLQGEKLRFWMESRILSEFADRVLPIDTAVALRCASFHVPDPRPERDALIAATAVIYGMTVVTRNTSDFLPLCVPLINPWES